MLRFKLWNDRNRRINLFKKLTTMQVEFDWDIDTPLKIKTTLKMSMIVSSVILAGIVAVLIIF